VNLLAKVIENLHPAYFAIMVMAKGIVSLASDMLGFESVARLLFQLNILAYGILCCLLIARIVWRRH